MTFVVACIEGAIIFSYLAWNAPDWFLAWDSRKNKCDESVARLNRLFHGFDSIESRVAALESKVGRKAKK